MRFCRRLCHRIIIPHINLNAPASVSENRSIRLRRASRGELVSKKISVVTAVDEVMGQRFREIFSGWEGSSRIAEEHIPSIEEVAQRVAVAVEHGFGLALDIPQERQELFFGEQLVCALEGLV